eukprot:CAMPEP_0168555988 /NCGR_PEP_ID=MMETSP0413-20121227/8639_1 /TAXON_ID=136452 /ORGANISM="Filamoeba nolandi, Strain NC-AS-23-1" /LENGTH=355 /DNA_ID=CAMNT_0008586897 /DNA_START=140 /DNA_END=1204 /DNA_ORIENTATION=+
MPIIKLVFADDIRRFALEKEANLDTIEKLVGSTFNLQPNEFNLNYIDEDNDKVSISTDEELEEAFQQANGQPLKINVQKLPGKVQDNAAKDFLRSSRSVASELAKPLNNSPPSSPPRPKSPILEAVEKPLPVLPLVQPSLSPLIALLSKQETQAELTELVVSTIQSPHFSDWLMNKDIIPQFLSLMVEVAKEKQPNLKKKEPVKAASAPILEPVKPAFNANGSVSIEEDKQQINNKIEEKSENENENKPAEEQGFVVVKKEPVILGEEEPVVEQPKEGLVHSLLSIFKPKKENEDEIPNQEELLKKLADMGFTDKEANIKTLRFHKKYNEGLDEVVEDLLLQKSGAKPAADKVAP